MGKGKHRGNKYNGIIFLFFLQVCQGFIFNPLFSQKISDELVKVRRVYSGIDNFSADVAVAGYETKKSPAPVQLGTGTLRKTKNGYYSKFAESEMVSNPKYTVLVNHEAKAITLIREKSILNDFQKQQMPDIDTLLAGSDSAIYKGVVSGMKMFCFFDAQADIYRTDLFVDAKSLFMKKIIYYYKEATEEESYDMDRVVIEYRNISLEKTGDSFFSEKKFIANANGKPVLTEAYKKYKLTVLENEEL